MMGKLAPLLAADGVDLDNLGDIDEDALNAALARASARHNLELFTPIGEERLGALAVLRSFALAIAGGRSEEAHAILAQVEPEPNPGEAAISHVIGVALGMLDRWFTDDAHRSALAVIRTPRWNKQARSAATDIDALTRQGRAFDTLDRLHHNHSGLAIFEGSALLVASAIEKIAASDGVTIEVTADELLGPAGNAEPGPVGRSGAPATPGAPSPAGPGRLSAHSTGAAFGLGGSHASHAPSRPAHPMTPSARDRPVVREFARWMRRHTDDLPEEIDDLKRRLTDLFRLARHSQLDLHHSEGAAQMADALAEENTAEAFDDLDVMHAYVHYRMATTETAAWEATHTAVEEALGESEGPPHAIAEALAADEVLDPAVREAALAGTRVVQAVDELLEWLGSGRPTTGTGGVRRADIQHLAGLLGYSAVGVSKRPPIGADMLHDLDNSADPMPQTIYAQSMNDVPPLAAWWSALRTTEVIDVGSTRTWPGPAEAAWQERPTPEVAEMLAAVFVAEVIAHHRHVGPAGLQEFDTAATVLAVLRALSPGMEEEAPQAPTELASVFQGRLRMHYLEKAGLVERDIEGEYVVPEALRGVVARGLIVAFSLLSDGEDS